MRKELRAARKAANLTQEEVSKLVGLSRAAFTHVELGTRTPSLRVASKIAAVFNKTIEDLFPAESATISFHATQNELSHPIGSIPGRLKRFFRMGGIRS